MTTKPSKPFSIHDNYDYPAVCLTGPKNVVNVYDLDRNVIDLQNNVDLLIKLIGWTTSSQETEENPNAYKFLPFKVNDDKYIDVISYTDICNGSTFSLPTLILCFKDVLERHGYNITIERFYIFIDHENRTLEIISNRKLILKGV